MGERQTSRGGHVSERRTTWAGRGTLGRRLLLLLATFSLGPLLVSNFWGYWVSRSFWLDSVVRDTRRIAEVEARNTHDTVHEQVEQVEAMGGGDNYLRSTTASLGLVLEATERQALRDKLSSHLEARADETAQLSELVVLSQDGTLIASSRFDRPSGVHFEEHDACRSGGEPGAKIRGLHYGGAEPLLVVATTMRTAGGTSIGVLCAMYRFGVHQALVAARHELRGEGRLYLLDPHGRVACSSGHSHDEHHFGELLNLRSRTQLHSNKPWTDAYDLPSGEEAIAAFVPVPSFPWGVLVEVPVSAALADLERLKWMALSLGAFLAAALTLAILVTSRTLAQHLARLAQAAQRIAAGSYGERIDPSGPIEIAQLAHVFNQMSASVQESQDLLARRIRDRTLELSESQEFAELLLDSIEHSVVVVDADLTIVKANRAARSVYGDTLIGDDYRARFGQRRADGDLLVERTLRSERPGVIEIAEEDGDRQDIRRIETYPVRSAAGDVTSVIELSRVVTAEHQTQAKMMHHEKMAAFGLLAAGIAHDIGNPIAAIESQLRLSRDSTNPERVRQTLAVVSKEVARIGRLLRDLVDFARRRRDAVALVSVEQVIEDVSRLLEHDPRARSVEIISSVEPQLPGIRAREDHLVQILLNLGINALDAMPEGGRLTFDASSDDDAVRIRVEDTGGGIPTGMQDHLFEAFVTSKSPDRGTGLGLFVSRAIARELGGDLELDSSSESGTAFVVWLPRRKPDSREERAHE